MKYYFLLVLITLGWSLTGQTNKFSLTGTITMQTGEQFPYKIVGTETRGLVKGFAYTYAEPDETKAVIEGQLDRQKKLLTFKETEILISHDVRTKAFMCLVHAKLEYRNNALSGPATSKQLDNTTCTPGTIAFNNHDEVAELFSSHDKFDMEVSMGGKPPKDEATTAPAAPPVEEPAKTEKITKGIEKAYDWYSDSLVLEIWDGGTFDGDRVSVTFDDDARLKRYTIQKTKKRVVFPVTTDGLHTLLITADDEGSDPPNTASLTIIDGTIRYNLLAYNSKGAAALIHINKASKKR